MLAFQIWFLYNIVDFECLLCIIWTITQMIDFYIQLAVRLYSKIKNCKPRYPLELLKILETNVSCSIPMLMISVGLAKNGIWSGWSRRQKLMLAMKYISWLPICSMRITSSISFTHAIHYFTSNVRNVIQSSFPNIFCETQFLTRRRSIQYSYLLTIGSRYLSPNTIFPTHSRNWNTSVP